MKPDTQPFYNSTIPSDWTTPEFGEVFTFLKSYSFSREQLSDEKTTDEIQNIHYGDIHATFEDEILDFEIEKRIPFIKDGLISTDKLSDEEFPFLKDGDLIIADASEDTIGVAECVELKNVNGRKIVSGLHTFAARDKKGETVPGYRTYLLRHPQVIRELRRIATGFSVFGISKTNLTKVRLPLPPHNEQEAFAELLNLMDTAINKNNQLIAKKELQKNGLMQKLLSGDVRLRGFKGEWSKIKLKAIAKIYDGTHMTPDYVEKGVPFYSVEQVTSNDFNKTKFISEQIFEKECERVMLEKGDILMTRIGDIGTPKYVDWNVRASFYVSLALIKITDKQTEGHFLNHFIKSSYFQKELHQRTIHVAFPKKINLGEIGECFVLLPPIEEQKEIAKVLQSADTEIQILRDKTIKLKNKKRGLIQQLLSGKKRLPTKSK
jgi:type I restriction enzyme S subunit